MLRLVDEAHAAASEDSRDAIARDLTPDVQGAGHAVLPPRRPTEGRARRIPRPDLQRLARLWYSPGRRIENRSSAGGHGWRRTRWRSSKAPRRDARSRSTHPVELGRDPEADIALLQDELISRRHVRLTPANGEVLVEDLGSRQRDVRRRRRDPLAGAPAPRRAAPRRRDGAPAQDRRGDRGGRHLRPAHPREPRRPAPAAVRARALGSGRDDDPPRAGLRDRGAAARLRARRPHHEPVAPGGALRAARLEDEERRRGTRPSRSRCS